MKVKDLEKLDETDRKIVSLLAENFEISECDRTSIKDVSAGNPY